MCQKQNGVSNKIVAGAKTPSKEANLIAIVKLQKFYNLISIYILTIIVKTIKN